MIVFIVRKRRAVDKASLPENVELETFKSPELEITPPCICEVAAPDKIFAFSAAFADILLSENLESEISEVPELFKSPP